MYVHIKSEPGLWTTGYYNPSGAWIADSDHSTEDEATARVHYLNGGCCGCGGAFDKPDPEPSPKPVLVPTTVNPRPATGEVDLPPRLPVLDCFPILSLCDPERLGVFRSHGWNDRCLFCGTPMIPGADLVAANIEACVILDPKTVGTGGLQHFSQLLPACSRCVGLAPQVRPYLLSVNPNPTERA